MGSSAPSNASGNYSIDISSGSIPKSAQLHKQITNTLFAFDTVVSLTASCAQETMDALAARCEYFESKFSRTIETSDIGRINMAAGAPVEVAPETADIIKQSLVYCEKSEGLFDITIGVVSTLWDFKEGIVADADALAEGVKHVDYRKVHVEGTTVTLEDPQAKLDLGGIAKGYIADDLCRMLVEAECDSGLVNLGGNIKTVGMKPDGTPWRVGIQDPINAAGFLFGHPVMMLYSAGGTALAFTLMAALSRIQGLSLVLVAIVGAILHNIGQLFVASVMLGTPLSPLA